MLSLWLHRVAFAPLLVAVLLAAFSFTERPRPIGTTIAPDAFDAARARTSLADLDVPGGALAARVDQGLHQPGFAVRRTTDGNGTRVVAERVGRDEHRLVVVARVGAAPPTPAQLSGTAALLGYARLFGGRPTRRTLTLAWVRDGAGGDAGVRALAGELAGEGEPVDAVLVLGDLAGGPVRAPLVVPWSDGGGAAPLRLRRTVEEAVRVETGLPAQPPRGLVQFARLAVPLTLSPQGAFGGLGLPAVTLQATGERGDAAPAPAGSPGAEVDADRLERFGRAGLRALTALDGGPDVPAGPREELVVAHQILPAWTIRLLAGLLLAPLVLAAVDGLARVRRRGVPVAPWAGWLGAAALPLVLAAVLARLLGLAGLLPAPGGPVAAHELPVRPAGLAVVALALVLGFLLRPTLLRAAGLRGVDPAAGPGAACAVALGLAAVGVLVWALNPFTALVLAPALHAWLLAAAPEVRSRAGSVLLVVLGLVPAVVLAVFLAAQLAVDPLALGWLGVLVLSGGYAGPVGVLACAALLACAVGALLIAVRKRSEPAPADLRPGPRTVEAPSRFTVLEPVSSR